MKFTQVIVAAAVCIFSFGAQAQDWPQFRGPQLDGSSSATGLPETWSTTENVVWKADLPGRGSSTPAIAGGRVFLTASDAQNELHAICLDSATGKVLWKHAAFGKNRRHHHNDMTSPSPVTDGKTVVFTFGIGVIAGFNAETGQPLWSRNLIEEYGDFAVMFSYGASPLLHKGVVYLQVLRRPEPYQQGAPGTPPLKSFVLALNLTNGRNIWMQDRPTDADHESHDSYVTPVPLMRNGEWEIIVVGGDYVTAHSVKDGSELWRYGYRDRKHNNWRVVPTPAVIDDMLIFATPRGIQLIAARPGDDGLTEDTIVWKHGGRTAPDVCSVVVYDGRVYIVDGDTRTLSCIEPETGRIVWQEVMAGGNVMRASPVAADGKIYSMNEDGHVYVAAAGDEYKLLAGPINMGGRDLRASIAIAENRLFIRTVDALYCVGK